MDVTVKATDFEVAIERLYETRYRAFCHMAATVTGDGEAARDAVQEGFARALTGAEKFRHEGSLEAWVWRIVLRAALDGRRHERRRLAFGSEVSVETWAPELPHPKQDPELAAALRALSPRQRLVIFLRYFVDLTHAEIAEFTGMRLGTVSATLAQAKAALAQRLDIRRPLPQGRSHA
jgi:RNA polymerase sigma-70 factor (ECF subfamily)